MARKQEYARIRIDVLEGIIATASVTKRIGYHSEHYLELAELLDIPVSQERIDKLAREYSKYLENWNADYKPTNLVG